MSLLRFENFELDLSRRRLSYAGDVLHLGGKAFDILAALVSRAGEVVGTRELLDAVWPDRTVEGSALRVHIVSLRKLLDGRSGTRCIQNVPGRGYVFVLPVSQVEKPTADEQPVPSQVSRTAQIQNRFPRLVARLIGRDEFVAQTAKALLTNRLVTIAGTGGIGKTSVALAVADILGRTGTVLFLDLASLSDDRLLMTTLATLLGVTINSTDDLEARALQALADQRLWMVFDNCEHLIEAAAAAVEKILTSSPGVSILATSREPLRVWCERVKRLPSLAVPPDDAPPGEISSYAAVQMFLDRFALGSELDDMTRPENLSVAAAIVRQLDGIPLAIELAASHAASLGLTQLAASLSNPMAVLRRGRRTAPPRQQTLRATLNWSYEGLTPSERLLLACLAVFAGQFTAQSGLALCAKDMSEEQFYEAFDGLFLKSFLFAVGGDGTYRLPEPTRHYALEKLADGGREIQRRVAHAVYCEEELVAAERDWRLLPTPQWMRQYATLINDVRAAVKWCINERTQSGHAIVLAARSSVLWMQLGLMGEQIELVQWALDALQESSYTGTEVETELRIAKGSALYHIRGPAHDESALLEFQRAAQIAQQIGDVSRYIRAISGVTSVWTSNGHYSRAINRALQLRQELPALPAHTFSRMLEHSYLFRGDLQDAFAQAMGSLQNAEGLTRLTLNAAVGYDQRMVALAVLAFVEFLQGNKHDAFSWLDHALGEARALDYAISSCLLLTTAAIPMVHLAGDRQRAAEYVETASILVRKHTLTRLQQWIQLYRQVLIEGADEAKLASPLAEAQGIRLEYCVVLAGERASLPSLDRALAGEGGWCRPELLRLKAERLVNSDPQSAAALSAEALELSQKLGARFWELRCAETASVIHRKRANNTAAQTTHRPH